MKRLAILGASGHGKVVAEIAKLSGWNEIVFFDDDALTNKEIEIWQVKGDTETLISQLLEFDGCIVAIGNNIIRIEKTQLLQLKSANIVSLIHPSAIVSAHSDIGIGSVIMAGVIINPFVRIGLSSIINTGTTIDHDSLLGDFVHISPGVNLAGGVVIGSNSWIGIGASIKQNVTIGTSVTIGAGSVVIRNIPNNSTAFGVPAKIQT